MKRSLLLSAMTLLICSLAHGIASGAEPVVIGIDHMPLVVKDVDSAADDYRKLGFAIKPGRLHDNGIVNNHIKFPDGSGIELITARRATDAMTERYRGLLAQGEGPAYLAFHARDTQRLRVALEAAHISYSEQGGLIKLHDPQLDFLFFVRDNRSSTDRPEHFAHANSAIAMAEVWIALRDPSGLERLLLALGATRAQEVVLTPDPITATVLNVENGKVVLLPESNQRIPGRPIVGATFRVREIAAVSRALRAANVQPTVSTGKSSRREIRAPASATHGITLSFVEN